MGGVSNRKSGLISGVASPVKGEWVREDILSMLDPFPGRVLSIGCGTGATEAKLKARGAEVWGVDMEPRSIETARGRMDHVFLGDLEVDDFGEIPRNYFDVIIAADVLEHLRCHEHVVNLLHHWLAPKGRMVLSVPNSSNFRVIKSLLVARDWRYASGGLFDRQHYRIFTRRSLTRLLAAAGFDVVSAAPLRSAGGRYKFAVKLVGLLAKAFPILDDYLAEQWIMVAECRKS